MANKIFSLTAAVEAVEHCRCTRWRYI